MKRTLPLLLALALCAPAFAQRKNTEPEMPKLVEQIDVRVINVDVVVTDKKGNPVPGLKKEDFEILEDGKPQTLKYFIRGDESEAAPELHVGLMFDTTIALTRLILSGVFDRHPRLKLVCPHVGGTLPYLIGRIYFSDAAGLRELAVGIFIGGLVYIPFCLYEIRLSPQLHRIVYGYHAHSFAQTYRFGGWRPTVFMDHGLMVGLWMAMSCLAGIWLYVSGTLRSIRGISLPWFLVPLVVTLVVAAGLLPLTCCGALIFLPAIQRLRSGPGTVTTQRVPRKPADLDTLAREIAGKPPLHLPKFRVADYDCLNIKLKTYYARKRKLYEDSYPDFYDNDLRQLFAASAEGQGRVKASAYLRHHRRQLMDAVCQWTNERKYRVNKLLTRLIDRCDQLDLYIKAYDPKQNLQASAYITTLVMNYLFTGKFKRTK